MFSYQPLYTLQLLAAAFSLALLAFVIEAIRRTHLEERYALLWLGAAGALFILSVYRPLLHSMARLLRIAYPPSLLFLVAFVFLLAIVLHFSLVLSAQRDAIRRLTQAVALLEHRVHEQATSAL
ncbi:MAG TPA: DUF2304 domain-containing protein [Candidatus Binatia bacterium]|nr:DUF2304 domain-containing protein [Candidatus Binatia bacterium]